MDRAAARILRTRWVVRLPIQLYHAGFGWLVGRRLVMIEHLGRASGQPRFVVVEVMYRERNRIVVPSGLGPGAQWCRNLKANGVAYLSTGRARRVPAHVRLLDAGESGRVLAEYTQTHRTEWKHLKSAMDYATGGDAVIPLVEFTPPR